MSLFVSRFGNLQVEKKICVHVQSSSVEAEITAWPSAPRGDGRGRSLLGLMQRHSVSDGDIARLRACQQERRRIFGRALDGAAPFFDVVVLLASDAVQSSSFEAEIAERKRAGQLPHAEYRCFSDGEFKIGNGGALMKVSVPRPREAFSLYARATTPSHPLSPSRAHTISHPLSQALAGLEAEFGAATVSTQKTLILPAGGYSTRLPQWGPRGKIFAPVAYERVDTGTSAEIAPATMLEMKLMNYVDLLPRLPAGSVFFAWSDMLVFFDPEGLDFNARGITVCAYPSTVSYGSRHAVLALAAEARRDAPGGRSFTCECMAYLEKASAEKMRSVGAVFTAPSGGEAVIVDADLHFDGPTCRMLAAFWRENDLGATLREEIDSSSDMLEQLGAGAPPSVLHAAGDTTSIVAKMHAVMRAAAVPIHAAVLQPASVLHIGTCGEYLEGYCAGIAELGGATRMFNKLVCTGPLSPEACIMHSVLTGDCRCAAQSVVEYSTLHASEVGAGSIVAFCDVAGGAIPCGTFLSTCPVEHAGAEKDAAFCCSVMALTDDVKAQPGTATFCGVPIEKAIAALALRSDDVWRADERRTLFNARLFPVAPTARAAATAAIAIRAFLLHHQSGSAITTPPWKGALMSMAEVFHAKSPSRDRAARLALVDEISSFLAARDGDDDAT